MSQWSPTNSTENSIKLSKIAVKRRNEVKDYLNQIVNYLECSGKDKSFSSGRQAREAATSELYKEYSKDVWVFLIEEMLSGVTGNRDEKAILAILKNATDDEREYIVNKIGYDNIEPNFQGEERDELMNIIKENADDDQPVYNKTKDNATSTESPVPEDQKPVNDKQKALLIHGHDPRHIHRSNVAAEEMQKEGWHVDVLTLQNFYIENGEEKEVGFKPPSFELRKRIEFLVKINGEKYKEIHFYLHGSEAGDATFDKDEAFGDDMNTMHGSNSDVSAIEAGIDRTGVIFAHSCYSGVDGQYWGALRKSGFDVRGIHGLFMFGYEEDLNYNKNGPYYEGDMNPIYLVIDNEGNETITMPVPKDHIGDGPWRRPAHWRPSWVN